MTAAGKVSSLSRYSKELVRNPDGADRVAMITADKDLLKTCCWLMCSYILTHNTIMVVLYTDTETYCVWYISHWMSKRVQLYTRVIRSASLTLILGFGNPNRNPNNFIKIKPIQIHKLMDVYIYWVITYWINPNHNPNGMRTLTQRP
jgi:hypothetical protein